MIKKIKLHGELHSYDGSGFLLNIFFNDRVTINQNNE